MLNRKPIFVGSTSRGGSTIVLNMLASHPDVCTVGETHQVFKGRPDSEPAWMQVKRSLLYDLPMWLTTQRDFMSPRLEQPRPVVSERVQRFIDRVLYRDKLRSRIPHFNLYKAPGVEYTREEIKASRMIAKNINGATWLSHRWTGRDQFGDPRRVGEAAVNERSCSCCSPPC